MVTKGQLVNGTFSLMRISGLTSPGGADDFEIGLQVADDYALELKAMGLDINWQQPSEYGGSDPSDNSGIDVRLAGPLKKLLVLELASHYGKIVPREIAVTAIAGRRAIVHLLVEVTEAQNPPTLPFGSGNEWDYRDRKFYSEPANNKGSTIVFKDDILNYTHDFSTWLIDEILETVIWEEVGSGITITNDSFGDSSASAQLTFEKVGGYTVCITATKTNSTDRLTVQKNFIINECQSSGLVFSF